MGGNTRDPKRYIFKRDVMPKLKEPKEPRVKKIAPEWIDLDELAFGKPKVVKKP